jgi:hypothetical protein
MKMPWTDKTGLLKAAVMFAMLLLVSLGLCGVNFVAVIRFVPMSGGASPHSWRDTLSSVLGVTGVLELVGMAIGAVGLISVGIAAAAKTARRDDKDARQD